MLFHVRSQGELAIPKADSSAFIERSRRLDRFYSIDADEAPFCADRLCCHGQQSTGMPRPPGVIRGSSESTQRPQVCHRERLRCIEYAFTDGQRREKRGEEGIVDPSPLRTLSKGHTLQRAGGRETLNKRTHQMRRRERRKWEFDVARATGADLFTTERVHKMDGRRASTNRGGMRF